ncbi:MAG: hemolysin III family protein [Rhodobacteraceae bacterium]|nr:hemolysin III family protein [Paracoccaceae bacterium]
MAYMYSPPERLADGTVHILGIVASVAATVLLILYTNKAGSGLDVAAVSVYGAMAILLFTVSALYHMTPWDRVRPTLQRIDHAAIYLKIAGTYTPLAVVLGSVFAYVVLGLIWAVALIGAVGKLTQWLKPGLPSTLLYIAMGWASVVLIVPLVTIVPTLAVGLMMIGGLLYTVGAFVNHWESLRYNVAIWHAFVLTGSALFFSAIVIALGATPMA